MANTRLTRAVAGTEMPAGTNAEWREWVLSAATKQAILDAVDADISNHAHAWVLRATRFIQIDISVAVLATTSEDTDAERVGRLASIAQCVKELAIDQADYQLASDALDLVNRARKMLSHDSEEAK